MPADGEIWGSKYPRPSAVAKVTGTLDYGADMGLKMPPDTLYMAWFRPGFPMQTSRI